MLHCSFYCMLDTKRYRTPLLLKKYIYNMMSIYVTVMFVPFTTLSGNDERPNMATPVVLSTSATIMIQNRFIGMPVNTYSAKKGETV